MENMLPDGLVIFLIVPNNARAIDLLNNLNERGAFRRFKDKVMRLNLKNKDWS